jgi:hypothetical protein
MRPRRFDWRSTEVRARVRGAVRIAACRTLQVREAEAKGHAPKTVGRPLPEVLPSPKEK